MRYRWRIRIEAQLEDHAAPIVAEDTVVTEDPSEVDFEELPGLERVSEAISREESLAKLTRVQFTFERGAAAGRHVVRRRGSA